MNWLLIGGLLIIGSIHLIVRVAAVRNAIWVLLYVAGIIGLLLNGPQGVLFLIAGAIVNAITKAGEAVAKEA